MIKQFINKQIEKLELDITLEIWRENSNLRVYVSNIDDYLRS